VPTPTPAGHKPYDDEEAYDQEKFEQEEVEKTLKHQRNESNLHRQLKKKKPSNYNAAGPPPRINRK